MSMTILQHSKNGLVDNFEMDSSVLKKDCFFHYNSSGS